MPPTKDSQRIQLRNLLDSRSMMRAQELREAGISAQTIARAVETGEIERISRGVYQKRGSKIEENQILAEAAIRVPKGVIALVSALVFHGLTDQMPRRIWMAIGASDWAPVESYLPMRMVRFTERYLRQGVENHMIAGLEVQSIPSPRPLPTSSATRSSLIGRWRWKACAPPSNNARRPRARSPRARKPVARGRSCNPISRP